MKEFRIEEKVRKYFIQEEDLIYKWLTKCIWWLKSLKERYAWKPSDVEKIKNRNIKKDYDESFNEGYSACHYNRWKPTDEQMDALNLAIGEANSVDTTAGDEVAEILTSLYE